MHQRTAPLHAQRTMILLISGATVVLRGIIPRTEACGRVGVLATPRAPALWARDLNVPMAADNDAFRAWNERRFLRMLDTHRPIASRMAWVAVRDVPGNAKATLEQWFIWAPIVRESGYRVAFVIQDGIENIGLPAADAYFIGGTDRYRSSGALRTLVQQLVDNRFWVHVGRVNSLTRYRYWDSLGCTSCDGTQHSRWADKYVLWMLRRTQGRQLALETLFD